MRRSTTPRAVHDTGFESTADNDPLDNTDRVTRDSLEDGEIDESRASDEGVIEKRLPEEVSKSTVSTKPSKAPAPRPVHNELERGSSVPMDWDSPSVPVQKSLNYGDSPRDIPQRTQYSEGLRSSRSRDHVRLDEASSGQQPGPRRDRFGAFLSSAAAPDSPTQSTADPFTQDGAQQPSNSHFSVQNARTVSQSSESSSLQMGRNNHTSNQSSIRPGSSGTLHAPREPRAFRREDPRAHPSRPAYRSGINPLGRGRGAGNILMPKRMSPEYLSPVIVRPTVDPRDFEPVKRQATEQDINSIPESSIAISDTVEGLDERCASEVTQSLSATKYSDGSEAFRRFFSNSKTAREPGIDESTTRKPAKNKAPRICCAACGSEHHSTRHCHIPAKDGTTIICPFHSVSVLRGTGNSTHSLDGNRRKDPNNLRTTLYCPRMMEYEDAWDSRNNAKYLDFLGWAFYTFIVERKRKPFCRVFKMFHCPIGIAIKYSDAFHNGEMPPQLKNGWPYTKQDATDPAIVARLRECGVHDWTKMPPGELESMTWAQIKKDYSTGLIPLQLHPKEPK